MILIIKHMVTELSDLETKHLLPMAIFLEKFLLLLVMTGGESNIL